MTTTQIEKLLKTDINKSTVKDYVNAKNVLNRLNDTDDWVKVYEESDWMTTCFITGSPLCSDITEAKLLASEQKNIHLEAIAKFVIGA